MPDPVTTLAERLQGVQLRCVDCGMVTHAREADYKALAREALAAVAKALPTKAELLNILWSASPGYRSLEEWQAGADAILRDLRARLGEK